MNDTENYYQQMIESEEKRLNTQRDNLIKECRRTIRVLKRRKAMFTKEIDYIERKIIPYIQRKKYMPQSYQNFLNTWEIKYLELEAK